MTEGAGGGDFVEQLLARCTFPPAGSHLDLAVSGGPDSLAMLVLAVRSGCRPTAHHVDHGLRPSSAGEAQVVEAVARKLGVGFVSLRVELAAGPNLEARARAARFAVLPPGVATGHTADDQAETILINLVRGAGLAGLAGMAAGSRHPILGLRRSETAALCKALDLEPVLDESNSDPSILRNRVRAEVLPLLNDVARRDVVPVLARQASLLAAEDALLDGLAAGVDPADAAALSSLDPVLARRAVRAWLRASDPEEHPPGFAAVERVLSVARQEVRACEIDGRRRVRRSGGRLRLEEPSRGKAGRSAPVAGTVPRENGPLPK